MAELKQKKQFENLWGTLQNYSGTKAPEKSVKIPNNLIGPIFQEVAKEREEKAIAVFKTKVIGIYDAKEALDKTLQKGRDELAKKEEVEYEKLNNELRGAFQMLQQVQQQGQQMVAQTTVAAPADAEGEEKGSVSEDQQ